jgi:hypothetical protein
MRLTRSIHATALTLAVIIGLAAATDSAIAQESPKGQWREFILVLFAYDEDDVARLANSAGFLVSNLHPQYGGYMAVAATCADQEDKFYPWNLVVKEFGSTSWCPQELLHVTAGGPRSFVLLWKEEIPPAGATCRTGPDSTLTLTPYRMMPATSSYPCDPRWSGKVVVLRNVDDAPQTSQPIIHGVGWFNR